MIFTGSCLMVREEVRNEKRRPAGGRDGDRRGRGLCPPSSTRTPRHGKEKGRESVEELEWNGET